MTEIMPFPKTIYCFIGPPLNRARLFYSITCSKPVSKMVRT